MTLRALILTIIVAILFFMAGLNQGHQAEALGGYGGYIEPAAPTPTVPELPETISPEVYEQEIVRLNQTIQSLEATIQHQGAETASFESLGYRQFSGVPELIRWLEADTTNEQDYIKDEHDCDDFSWVDLILAGAKDNRFIGPALDLRDKHAICFTVIRNEVWLIEPQSDQVEFFDFID